MSPLAALRDLASSRADGASMAVARILLGVAALVQALDFAPVITRLLEADSVRLPLHNWIPVLPAAALSAYFLVWCFAALAFTVGFATRFAGCLLAVILGYSILIDQQTYSNHVYLMTIVTALVAIAGSGNRLSIDRRLGRGQPDVPAWPGTLIKVQLSIVYFFAAVSKINIIYLAGVTIAPNLRASWLLPVPESWVRWEVMLPIAMASILTEIFLAFAFWSRRWRPHGLAAGFGLHVLILVAYPLHSLLALTVFALVMFAMYVQFVNVERIVRRSPASHGMPSQSGTEPALPRS